MQKEITALAPSTMKIKIIAPQRENTLSGSEVPSLLPSPHSKPCGSPSKTTTKLVHPSSTEMLLIFSFRYIFSYLNHKTQIVVNITFPTFRILSYHDLFVFQRNGNVVSAVYYSAYEPQVLCIGIRFRFENKVIYVNEDIYRKIENCIWHYFI